jgi:hypothetical protein
MHFENDLRTRAEKLVLSALLQDNRSIRHIANLTPRHFSHDTNGQIFRAIVWLIEHDEPADACSVFSLMDKWRQLRRIGLFSYLCELSKLPAVPANIGYYACALTGEQPIALAIRLVPVKVIEHAHGVTDPGHSHGISVPAGAPRIWFGLDMGR